MNQFLFRKCVPLWSHRLFCFGFSRGSWLDVSVDRVFDDDLLGLFHEDCVLFVYQFLLELLWDRVLLVDLVSDRVDDGDRNPGDEEGEKQNHYDSCSVCSFESSVGLIFLLMSHLVCPLFLKEHTEQES